MYTPAFDNNSELSAHHPPRLCATGRLLSTELQHAISLGSGEDSFWVVTLESRINPFFWIQLTDHCINITDAIPRASKDCPDLKPYLTMASQSPGTFITFSFESPVAVDCVAAATCRYMKTMFPSYARETDWAKRIYEAKYNN